MRVTRCIAALAAMILSGCAGPFDAPPLTHGGKAIVEYMPRDQVDAACRSQPNNAGHYEMAGCARVIGPFCHVIIRLPTRDDRTFAGDLAHEFDHCQGWTHPAWGSDS